MLELRRSEAVLLGCYARPAALAALRLEEAHTVAVARDELLLIGAARELRDKVERRLAENDPNGLVVDRTDAFAIWTLAGDAAGEAFARLSAIPLPRERPALVQGLVAHVPAKVVALDDALHVLVASTVAHHLRARVLEACADLDPRERAPALLALPT